jgi:hypothetical protein
MCSVHPLCTFDINFVPLIQLQCAGTGSSGFPLLELGLFVIQVTKQDLVAWQEAPYLLRSSADFVDDDSRR